ncbi:alpha/beta hydrolase family protein [Aquimarina spongiae]|uniref:Alpha/beta hydrolase family protein n=1 Tax=Aquimarina spongiae TaxID=570521 RepID=A0A1M6FIE6_9FLAO|nr:alpha/beta fold hydrolase [Aquimarina spongiae]SHI97467.1 Alpha/beta hydrolase family protein [Aquimarina spongiae]
MITRKKNIVLEGNHGKPIVTDVFYTNKPNDKPIIIFCHGYKGFKDWGAWDLMAEAFANAGFVLVKFNFSHNGGTVEQPIDFPDLEAFANNTFIKELDDLETVLDWITNPDNEILSKTNAQDITLIGHSRGGGIVVIKAAEDPRVTKLITWAGVSDYKNRFPKGEAFKQWEKDGVFYVENGRTKQQMPHYFDFYSSFIDHEERLTISKAAAKIAIPYLIVHGTQDPTVHVQEAYSINAYNPNASLFLVEGADHVFGARHPCKNSDLPKDLEKIIEKSIEFARL